MADDIVVADNLGPEFELGTTVPNKITVRVDGTSVVRDAVTGELSAPGGGGGGSFQICTFEKLLIWAEESGALSDNNVQWSFGNGSTGNIGIAMLEDWEIYGWSFQSDTQNPAANGSSFEVMNMVGGTATVIGNFVVANAENDQGFFATPIPLAQGAVLGFRTDNEQGAISDARIAAWLRREVCQTITF